MKNKLTLLTTILIIGSAVFFGYLSMKNDDSIQQLPVINPIDIDEDMVSEDVQGIGFGHRVGKFSFKDQDNQLITNDIVKGKIWVAEYFFTTCTNICIDMNQQMKKVQAHFKNDEDIKILSFTVDPVNDTSEQLKKYADEHGAINGKWFFLTGEKEQLYNFARQSIFVLKPAEAANLGDAGSDFIHTNNFVLIDKVGRIRGYYDGTKSEEVEQLIKDIQLLKQEKDS